MVVYAINMYYHFYYEDTMASFDNLVNSLANNSSAPASTPTPTNAGTPTQGPLIDDLTRAQLANMNMTNQQVVNAVQQSQAMQRYIGMDNHLQDYVLNGTAAAVDAVGSLGALGGQTGEHIADATLGNVARGLRSLTSSDSQHRQELKANTGAWLSARSQAQYQKDLASGKSQTEASLAKIGRDAVNYVNSQDLGMMAAESTGSLAGSFVGGGLLGKAATLGAKGIMAAKAAKTIAGKAATYEKTIAELSQVRAEAQAAAQAGKISMDEATATIQKIDADVAKLNAKKEGILADQAALTEQQQAVMQAQDLNKARQSYMENQVGNEAQITNEALATPSREVLDTEAKALNNRFDRLINYKETNNKRLADTNHNITTTASQKPIQEAKYNTAQKQYADAVTKANETEGKLTKTESDFDKFKQNRPEIEAKLNKQVEAKATKVGEEVGGIGINFAYGADAGADAVKDMHLENLSDADLQNSKEYKDKKQEYLNKGLSPEDASAKAIADIRGSIERTTRLGVGAWEAAVSKIMGTSKIEGKGLKEGLLNRLNPMTALGDTAKETSEEVAQGIGETLGGNISEKRIDNSKDLTEGLGEAIAENAFGIPAGMAGTKAVGTGLHAAKAATTLTGAASVGAGVMAYKGGKSLFNSVKNAVKNHTQQKNTDTIMAPVTNEQNTVEVDKENKAWNNLKDTVKDVLRPSEQEGTQGAFKNVVDNTDLTDDEKDKLTKSNNLRTSMKVVEESFRRQAKDLETKDTITDDDIGRMAAKVTALHTAQSELVNRIQNNDKLTQEEKQDFIHKLAVNTQEVVQSSPKYREAVLKMVDKLDDNTKPLAQNLWTTVQDVAIADATDRAKKGEDASRSISALEKVVKGITGESSFDAPVSEEQVKNAVTTLDLVKQYQELYDAQSKKIQGYVDEAQEGAFTEASEYSSTGKSSSTLLNEKFISGYEYVNAQGETRHYKGMLEFYKQALNILSSADDDSTKQAKYSALVKDFNRFKKTQQTKFDEISKAYDTYLETQEPQTLENVNGARYTINERSGKFIDQMAYENSLMSDASDTLTNMGNMINNKYSKPKKPTPKPNNSKGNPYHSLNSFADGIVEAFNKPTAGIATSTKGNNYTYTKVDKSLPITLKIQGQEYKVRTPTEFKGGPLAKKRGKLAFNVLQQLFRAHEAIAASHGVEKKNNVYMAMGGLMAALNAFKINTSTNLKIGHLFVDENGEELPADVADVDLLLDANVENPRAESYNAKNLVYLFSKSLGSNVSGYWDGVFINTGDDKGGDQGKGGKGGNKGGKGKPSKDPLAEINNVISSIDINKDYPTKDLSSAVKKLAKNIVALGDNTKLSAETKRQCIRLLGKYLLKKGNNKNYVKDINDLKGIIDAFTQEYKEKGFTDLTAEDKAVINTFSNLIANDNGKGDDKDEDEKIDDEENVYINPALATGIDINLVDEETSGQISADADKQELINHIKKSQHTQIPENMTATDVFNNDQKFANKSVDERNKYLDSKCTFLPQPEVTITDAHDEHNQPLLKDPVAQGVYNQAVRITDKLLETAQKMFDSNPAEFMSRSLMYFFRFNDKGRLIWATDTKGNSIEENIRTAIVYSFGAASTRSTRSINELLPEGATLQLTDAQIQTANQVGTNKDNRYITKQGLGDILSSTLNSLVPRIDNSHIPDRNEVNALTSSILTAWQAATDTKDKNAVSELDANPYLNRVVIYDNGSKQVLDTQKDFNKVDYTTGEVNDNGTLIKASMTVLVLPKGYDSYAITNSVDKQLLKNKQANTFTSVVLTDEEAKEYLTDAPVMSHLNHHPEQPLSTLQRAAIKADRLQKHVITTFGKILNYISDEAFQKARNIPSTQFVNELAEVSRKGREGQLLNGLQYIRNTMKQMKDGEGLYYNHEMTAVSRMNSSDYMSPRNNKEIRETISPIEYEVSIFLKDGYSEEARLKRSLWLRMVAQGLGQKVQHMSDGDVNELINSIYDAYNDSATPFFKEYAELANKAANGEQLTEEEQEYFNDLFIQVNQHFVAVYGEDAQTTLGIHAYTDLLRAIAAEGPIKSSLYGEADGITNGIFFSKLMLGSISHILKAAASGKDVKAELANLARVGFFVGQTSKPFYADAIKEADKTFGSVLKDGKVQDTYTNIATQFTTEYAKAQDEIFGKKETLADGSTSYTNSKIKVKVTEGTTDYNSQQQQATKVLYDSMDTLLVYTDVGNTQNPDGSILFSRMFTKRPATKANYQAGPTSISNEFMDEVELKLLQKLNGYKGSDGKVYNWRSIIASQINQAAQNKTLTNYWGPKHFDKDIDNIKELNFEQKEELKKDVNAFLAVTCLNRVTYTKDKTGSIIGLTYHPELDNRGFSALVDSNGNPLTDARITLKGLRNQSITAVNYLMSNHLLSTITKALGDEVDYNSKCIILASNILHQAFVNHLLQELKERVDPENKIKDENKDKLFAKILANAKSNLSREELKKIVRENISKYQAIITNKSGTAVFNYKTDLNTGTTDHDQNDDINIYDKSTGEVDTLHYSKGVSTYTTPGVAAVPTSTIGFGDGETMNKFIVQILEPLGLSYNDVFDGLNLSPDEHAQVGDSLNKIAANTALQNSPLGSINKAFQYAVEKGYVTAEDLNSYRSNASNAANATITDILELDQGGPSANPQRVDYELTLGGEINIFKTFCKTLDKRAKEARMVADILASHYMPYSCCQYAFSPNGGYSHKAYIDMGKKGEDQKIYPINDINDADDLVKYMQLTATFFKADKDTKEKAKQDMFDFLADKGYIDKSSPIGNVIPEYEYDENSDMEDAEDDEYIEKVNNKLRKLIQEQQSSNNFGRVLVDNLKGSKNNQELKVARWLQSFLKKMSKPVTFITDPELIKELHDVYEPTEVWPLTNGAIFYKLEFDGKTQYFICNAYMDKNVNIHEAAHCIASLYLRDNVNKIDETSRKNLLARLKNGEQISEQDIRDVIKNEKVRDDLANLLAHLSKIYSRVVEIEKGPKFKGQKLSDYINSFSDLGRALDELFAQTLQSRYSAIQAMGNEQADSYIVKKLKTLLQRLKDVFKAFFHLGKEDKLDAFFGNSLFTQAELNEGKVSNRVAAMALMSNLITEKSTEDTDSLSMYDAPVGEPETIINTEDMPITMGQLNNLYNNKRKDPKFLNLVKAFANNPTTAGTVVDEFLTAGVDVGEDGPFVSLLDTMLKDKYFAPSVVNNLHNLYSTVLKSPELKELPDSLQNLLIGDVNDKGMDNHKTTTAGLTNFIYLGMRNQEVKSMLAKLQESNVSKSKSPYKIDRLITDSVVNAVNALTKGRNISDALNATMAKGVAQHAILKNLDTISDVETFVEGKGNTLLNQAINKTVDITGTVLQHSGLKSLKNAGDAIKAAKAASDIDTTGSNWAFFLNTINSKVKAPQIVHDVLRDFAGIDAHNFPVYALLKKITARFDREAYQRTQAIPQLLKEKFKNLQKGDEVRLAKHFLKLDLTSLMDGVSIDRLSDVIKYPKESIEEYQQNLTPLQKKKAAQLGHYLATGESGYHLLQNAHAICAVKTLDGKLDPSAIKESTVAQIDKLVSCYALMNINEDDRKELARIVDNNQEAMQDFIDMHNSIKKSEIAKLGKNPLNYHKGYLPRSFKNNMNYKVVYTQEEVKRAKTQGWKFVSKLDKLGNAGEMYLIKTSLPDPVFHKGVFQNISTKVFGTNKYGNSNTTLARPLKVDQYNGSPETATANEPIPVFNQKGNIKSYDRPVILSDDLYDDDAFTALGKWSANDFMETAAKEFNKEAIHLAKNMYDRDLKSFGKDWVKDTYVDLQELVNVKKDKVVADAISRLPQYLIDALEKEFDGRIFIRKDMVDTFLGYRSASITDAWTGISRWSPKTLNRIAKLSNKLLGQNAYLYLGHAERAIEYTTSYMRSNIVVRSVAVPYMNAVSNILQLRMRGISYLDILQGINDKVKELEQYRQIEKQTINLKARLLTETDPKHKKVLEHRLADNKQRISMMTIAPMIEQGELSTLADVGDSYNDSVFTGEWADKIHEYVNKLPSSVVNTGKWLTVSKDSDLYKLMEKATTYGDFVAKSIYYDHLIQNGMDKEMAARKSMEEFVNYDMMAGRSREYLENLGIIWFYNYRLRITKASIDAMLHNPASILLVEGLTPDILLDNGTLIGDSFLGKLAQGQLGSSFLPLSFFNAWWSKNPYLNLLDTVF